MSRLAFDRAACLRGGRVLFENVQFALESGQAAIVTGPNGTGKSSLLRVAAGLLEAAAGTVTREGRIALADENAALDRDRTLGEALDFWARLDGGRDRRAAALAALGMEALAPVPVRMLSTGQRKRAALARVIASGADIWLLDEPTNGLDTDAIARLEAACVVHVEGGGIVLAATHQPLQLPNCATVPLTPFASSAVEKRVPTALDTNGFQWDDDDA